MVDFKILKYPRTQHLQGSRLQEGDEDLRQVPFSEILGKYIVIEEKIDGANSAISFDANGNLLLQSRGHYLNGGYNERHFNLMKQWANNNKDLFYSVLGSRYIMYGEWMYAKHTVFYDALPDYFMEFDIYDREKEIFLDTDARKIITDKLQIVHSVPVLSRGVFKSKKEILSYLGNSNYITENHIETLKALSEKQGLDDLKNALKDKLSVLAGQSAVGKSSLINALFGTQLKTGEVSDIGRGRHTTTCSKIYEFGDIRIMDTPGFAVLETFIELDDLKFCYPEFNEYLGECKFRGCTHTGEPDCKIQTLAVKGKIPLGRYERYKEIYNELKRRKKFYE